MGNIRYQRTAHRITSAVNCRPLKPSPRSICPAAPYPTGVHIPGIPPPAKFATEPANERNWPDVENSSEGGLVGPFVLRQLYENSASSESHAWEVGAQRAVVATASQP